MPARKMATPCRPLEGIDVNKECERLSSPEGREFGVTASTYVVIGFVSAMPLIAGFGLYGEGRPGWSVACAVLALFIFVHFCFQKLVFSNGNMALHRPFFPEKSVTLSRVTAVSVALVAVRGRPAWQCVMTQGEAVLLKFNPKLFSFGAIDYMLKEVLANSAHASIYDGTRGIRPGRKKK